MIKLKSIYLPVIVGFMLVFLTGCDKIDQAKTDALEKAKQAASKALNDVQQSGSIDQAKESANQAIIDAKQAAAGMLGQASEYLEQSANSTITENNNSEIEKKNSENWPEEKSAIAI